MFNRKPRPRDAVAVFEGVLSEGGLTTATLTPAAALDTWLRFARTAFQVPRVPEADGLLYQYGVYDLTGEPRFHLDLTRQFAVARRDEYVQFHCDVQLPPTGGLRALGRHEDWWFTGQDDLDDWGSSLRARPEWRLLEGPAPLDVRLYVEET